MSKVVPLEGFGGGGTPLNFKIVAYATEEELAAAQPKENTIGVVTTTPINGWVFSAEEPTELQEGLIWIDHNLQSSSSFNGLKKNTIKIYPGSARQYINNEWITVTALTYQNNQWIDWLTYLYNNGDECIDITGGWQGRSWASVANDGQVADSFVLTKNATSMHCQLNQNRSGVVEIKNNISLKGKKYLKLQCENVANVGTSIALRMAIINRTASYWYTNALSIVIVNNGIITLDLSNYQNDSTYDIIIGAVTNQGSGNYAALNILKVWLE